MQPEFPFLSKGNRKVPTRSFITRSSQEGNRRHWLRCAAFYVWSRVQQMMGVLHVAPKGLWCWESAAFLEVSCKGLDSL